MVKAKFRVDSITRSQTTVSDSNGGYAPSEVQTVKMWPVSGGSDENNRFWASTPSGVVELGCVNLEAAKQFELGKEYYLTFEPA